MNLLLVTAMFPPIRTGTSYYSSNLATALAQRGHAVTVATLRNADADDAGFPYRVVRMPAVHVPLKNYFKHFRISSCFPENYAALQRLAREMGAQAVVLVNHYLDIAFPALYAAWRNHIPLICSVGTQLQSPRPLRHRILNALDRLICGTIIFPRCRRVVAWDNEILRYLDDVHGVAVTGKSVVINYGVNGDLRTFLAHSHDYRTHNQLLGVGAVIEQRDFMPLLRAFRILAPEFPDLRLKIIGHVYYEAPRRYAEAQGLGDRVVFTGEMAHADVLKELERSDLFFATLTGRYVGLGTATVESMLMGVPTIANAYADLLGTARLKDMEHIALLSTLAPEHIADRMRALLSNRDLRTRMGGAGRAFVIEHLSWEKVAADYERMLEALATAANP